MATINRILLFTGILAIGLGATVPHLPQAFASGKSTDFGSEGSKVLKIWPDPRLLLNYYSMKIS